MPLSGNRRSIAAMLCAVALFSFMDNFLKVLSAHYPPTQVTALRGLAAMPLVCLYILWRREVPALFARGLRWKMHLLRGLLGVTMMGLFTFGLQTLGLAEAYTITFVAPFLITMLSIPLLKEQVPPRHWIAIAVGLCGVVVALRPDANAFVSSGAIAVLVAAGCYALSNVVGRLISRTEPSVTLVFYTTGSMAVGGLLLSAWRWVDIAPAHWPVLVGLAVTGFLAQLAITEAFRHGQASAVAPFEYTALAFAIAIDWFVWHTMPDAWTLVGGAIIIGSGIYLIRHEKPVVAGTAVPP